MFDRINETMAFLIWLTSNNEEIRASRLYALLRAAGSSGRSLVGRRACREGRETVKVALKAKDFSAKFPTITVSKGT